ncbi:uncharacterized protein HMPREF1541_04376 [Cyphellophora europaea CBS 101466]|uniref:3CxxC-type domain-containing protein n=1 Tax=Cyphellophora europaea (strain CBS 101466) TaxID=1220924 RepID=W2RUA8_CYPE1|nr:uncharacterized protein HMPREF1541_04376 [Cyphellophora europaea CBS 101466]ETN40101.1 hypothetical protein HMPREF1541_04376 [Cyphellophora europaea CBS 101466]
MAKKKTLNPTPETRKFLTFPWHHKDILKAVTPNLTCTWVRKGINDRTADREYTTHVMGNFRCINTTCSTSGWSSKKVAIQIRGYTKNGYNAVVFNQRCKECNQLGTLFLDKESYVERVSYRIQKWAGIKVEQPFYASREGLPHKQELCEGCKRGVCRQANDWA